MRYLDKTFSYLFLINCVFLLTAPYDRIYDIIHNSDRYVGFIPLGMLASAADTAESIA